MPNSCIASGNGIGELTLVNRSLLLHRPASSWWHFPDFPRSNTRPQSDNSCSNCIRRRSGLRRPRKLNQSSRLTAIQRQVHNTLVIEDSSDRVALRFDHPALASICTTCIAAPTCKVMLIVGLMFTCNTIPVCT